MTIGDIDALQNNLRVMRKNLNRVPPDWATAARLPQWQGRVLARGYSAAWSDVHRARHRAGSGRRLAALRVEERRAYDGRPPAATAQHQAAQSPRMARW